MVKSIEERQLRRSSLARGFTTSIVSFKTENRIKESSTTCDVSKPTPSREDKMISLFYDLKDLLEKEMLQW